MKTGFVLITGCSSGIGRACAEHLMNLGCPVIATVRKDADAQRLSQESAGKLIPLLLDVTSEDSIRTASEKVKEIVGENGLQGLVNNAGGSEVGPVEFVSIERWKRQFDLNFFGQISLTQKMLPLLRQHVSRNGIGSARIILMSSIAGRLSQPLLSPYCASKHALEALGDALRLELRPQGIQTSIIEPGAIKSEIWDKGKAQVDEISIPAEAQTLYGELIKNVEAAAMNAKKGAIDAIYVARAVEKCLTARKAPVRIVVGQDAKLGALARSYLPYRWVDGVIARMMGVPKTA